MLAAGAATLVRRHPIKLSLNILGLILLFAATGYRPSPAATAAYAAALPSASLLAAERSAGSEAATARAIYSASRGWFWTCDAACTRYRAAADAADTKWALARDATEASMRKAKSELGLFSSAGVDEARDQFWRSFAGGTAYAKRATLWDALFVGMRSMGRDEPLLNFVLQMAIRLITNLSVGIFGGVMHFFWEVVGIIRSYDPSIFTAVGFFSLCLLVGASFFVSAITALFGGAALVVVGGANLLRIAAQQQQVPQRVRAHEE